MLRFLPFAAAAVVTLGVGGAFGGLPASSQSPSSSPTPSTSAAPTVTAVPTWIPLASPPPTAFVPAVTPAPAQGWSPPAWYAGTLRPGVWVRMPSLEALPTETRRVLIVLFVPPVTGPVHPLLVNPV